MEPGLNQSASSEAPPPGRRGRRATVSLSDLRTPIVDNFLSMLPTGHEKALKYAFFNVLALVISSLVLIAFGAVYCILEPFIKPLLWALLCGSVLHPFKANLSSCATSWLKSVKGSPTPLAISVITSPLRVADSFSERIVSYVWTYWRWILSGLGLFFVSYFVYYNPPVRMVLIGQWIFFAGLRLLCLLLSWVNGKVVIALNLGYAGLVVRAWMQWNETRSRLSSPKEDQQPSPESSPQPKPLPDHDLLKIISYINWTLTLPYLAFQVPYAMLVMLGLLGVLGTVTYLRQAYTLPAVSRAAYIMVANIKSGGKSGAGSSGQEHVIPWSPRPPLEDTVDQPSAESTPVQGSHAPLLRSSSELSCLRPNLGPRSDSSSEMPSSAKGQVDGLGLDSNTFLYGVFLACLLVQVWNRLWLLHLIPIPVLYYGAKRACFRLGIQTYVKDKVKVICQFYHETNVVPPWLQLSFRILYIGDRKVISICETYANSVISIIVLLSVVMATVLALIFASIQVYAEGDHLVRVGVNLLNSTVTQHPEINQLLPEGWDSILDSMVGNAYLYGKESIRGLIRDSEENPEKAALIERQVIEIWDRIYLSWNQTWENAYSEPNEDSESPGIGWEELMEKGKQVPKLLDLAVLANYAKSNYATLWAILESVWNILIGNISLVFSALTALVSVLFGGGTALLNLVLNLVVFATALFYLIAASNTVYKPVELLNGFTPGSGANNFAKAVEDAVNGVFVASFKMAAFYGMWTWLIHTLFQVNIVFVPSIFGALFGAVPFISPYMACLPAVLEIWLIQGHWTKAAAMFLAHLVPMGIGVDTQIYSEIKSGGHPYLTGLAIAGGIFYFGFQGAIMGPVVLCCVFVAIQVGSNFLREEGTGPGSKLSPEQEVVGS